MIHCSGCGKTVEKVPDWLQGVKVEFVCNNCPNRQTKNIAFVSLAYEAPATKAAESEVEADEVTTAESEE